MKKWLVTGARGMLGSELVQALSTRGEPVTAAGHRDLDITDPDAVNDAVRGHDVVVNLAAWTDVDGAEGNEEQAHRVNAVGPARLATACQQSLARLVQLSTDYVFDGTASAPYPEDAQTRPLNAYGRTKLDGEIAVRELLPDRSFVVRTSWLYGASGRSFVSTMARLAGERETLDVVDDQRGQPTWTRDVAHRIVELVDRDGPPGTYHATSAGDTTWYGLARAVFEELGLDPDRVRPTSSESFKRSAARPAYSVLGHDAWSRVGLSPLRPWRDALRAAAPSVLGQPRSSIE